MMHTSRIYMLGKLNDVSCLTELAVWHPILPLDNHIGMIDLVPRSSQMEQVYAARMDRVGYNTRVRRASSELVFG